MEAKGRNCRREKAIKRKAVLEKKRLIEGTIKAAYSVKDHLSCFPHFRHYQKNGLFLHLESGRGNKLSHCAKQYIQDLLKLNMEAPYGSEWPAEEKMKRREMVADEARYILVHEISNKDANGGSELLDKKSTCNCNGPIVGFVHYRFVLEEEVPVLYIYELQLEPRVQGKGLGKFLMLLIELIACENKMGAVVLTVQRENLLAMDFYINKLRYSISAISPSRVDPLLGVDKSYEILCKTFDNEAQAVLKGERYPLHPETIVCKTCGKTAGTTSTSSSTASSKVSPPFAKRTKREWAQQTYKKVSDRNKKNHASDCDSEEFPKHAGGSILHKLHMDRLNEMQGHEPTVPEYFMHTHLRMNTDEERLWLNNRSQSLHDTYVETPMATQNERWTELAGISKKGQVYGLAGLAHSQSYHSTGHQKSAREKELEIEVHTLKEQIVQMRGMQTQLDELEAHFADIDQLKQKVAMLTSTFMAQQQNTHLPYPTPRTNIPAPTLPFGSSAQPTEDTTAFVPAPFYPMRPHHDEDNEDDDDGDT